MVVEDQKSRSVASSETFNDEKNLPPFGWRLEASKQKNYNEKWWYVFFPPVLFQTRRLGNENLVEIFDVVLRVANFKTKPATENWGFFVVLRYNNTPAKIVDVV